MTSQSSFPSPQNPLGMFTNQQDAEQARQALQQAGFSAETISVNPQALDPNPQRQDSQSTRGAQGGAIAGAVVGCLVGLILVLLSQALPQTQGMTPITVGRSGAIPFFIVLGGGIVGAIATSLIGALSGVSVPNTDVDVDRDRLADNYLVNVQGTDAERQRAQSILRDQGSKM